MNERDYKGYTIGQYYKNGANTKYWYADKDGVEVVIDYSTLRMVKNRIDELIDRLRISKGDV